jgi:hypothetical protein
VTTQLEAGMAPCLSYQCNVILPLDRSKFLIVAWASGKVGLFMPDKWIFRQFRAEREAHL